LENANHLSDRGFPLRILAGRIGKRKGHLHIRAMPTPSSLSSSPMTASETATSKRLSSGSTYARTAGKQSTGHPLADQRDRMLPQRVSPTFCSHWVLTRRRQSVCLAAMKAEKRHR
jgi:hypothetical protein